MAASLRRAALRLSRRIAAAGIRWFSEPLHRQIRLVAVHPQPLVGLFAGALLLGTIVVGANSPGAAERAPLLAATDLSKRASAPSGPPVVRPAANRPTKFTDVIPFITPPAPDPPPPALPPKPPVAAPTPPVGPQLAANQPEAPPQAPAAADEPVRRAEKAVPVVAVPKDRALIAANRLDLEPDHCQAAGPEDQFGTLVHWARNLNAAARQARAEKKLVFAMQLSGNFANQEFT